MREYRFQASDETVERLRRLRGAWLGFSVSDRAFSVTLAVGATVRVQVEAADIEDAFEAFRLEAFIDEECDQPMEAAGDFAEGGNDVVLFTGATWSEAGARTTESLITNGALPNGSTMHMSGHPGQLSETADIVCLTTDSLVVATGKGTGLLVRTGLKPLSIEVVRDPVTIATFLHERGYRAE